MSLDIEGNCSTFLRPEFFSLFSLLLIASGVNSFTRCL